MQKKILITGVSSGVGHAAAKLLLEKDCSVIGLSRREPKDLNIFSPKNFFWHFCDFSMPDSVSAICQNILNQYQDIDIVVHCAAEGHFQRFGEMEDKKIQALINVNFTSPLILTKHLLGQMKKSGQVVFTTSAAAKIPSPLSSIYAALKLAQEKLVESLNIEYNDNIKFKILRPGLIKTEFLSKSGIPEHEISFKTAQTAQRVAINLLGLIKNKKIIKNSGSALPVSLAKAICPELLRLMVKRRYLNRLRRLNNF